MNKIKAETIEQAVYNLCVQANTCYDAELYNKLYDKYLHADSPDNRNKYANILENISLASKIKRPLCQDTGQVIVFVTIGQNTFIDGTSITDAVNNGVKKAYKQNYFRKSVVQNALFDRTNTDTNTPAIVYYDYSSADMTEVSVLIKGAGSENYCRTKMFSPASQRTDIFDFVEQTVKTAGEKSCPPLVLGIGVGGTMDSAAVLSKKAFFKTENTQEEKQFINELNEYLDNIKEDILDIKLLTSSTHIACLPVAVTINCHSTRHAMCTIKGNEISYLKNPLAIKSVETASKDICEIKTDEYEKIKNLKTGDEILLTGEIYTARDAAHKRILDFYTENNKFPFDIKDKIIFYAGPCPAAPHEIIGPVGPTTSARMDGYCDLLYSNGLLATIGKGERSEKALNTIIQNNGKYFIAQGGIACLLAKCIKSSQIVAFEELGTEAVRKLYVEKLPLKVVI